MSSVRRRGLAAASLAIAAAFTLSACGTGFGAQTNQVYQPGVGANARGEVDSLNTLLVANTDGSATVSASLLNNAKADQSLSSVTVTTRDDKPLDVRSTKILLPLPHGTLTSIGDADGAGIFTVVKGADAGGYVKVTFSFTDSNPLTIQAPVVKRTDEYSSVAR